MSEAVQAIEGLIYAYAERMDAGDFDAVADLFAGASYGAAGGPVLRGREKVRNALDAAVKLYDGVPRTKHVTTNVTVEVDAEAGRAAARSYFTVVQSRPDGRLETIVAGRYADGFARRDGRWCFTAREIHMDLVGDVSDHLTFTPES